MAKQDVDTINPDELADTLKKRGLTCKRLRGMENSRLKNAQESRKVGFTKIAELEEESAKRIGKLRKQVCRNI